LREEVTLEMCSLHSMQK